MFLQKILLPEFIKIDLEADNKEEAFNELIAHYCKTDKSSSHKEIFKAIITREDKMSTGIHKGVAVPHGKTNAVNSVRGALGISRKGIQYDSLDGEPVYLLFLIIFPLDDTQEHLRFLKHLAAILDIPDFLAELRSQHDPKEASAVICKFEKMLSSKSALN